MDDCAQECDDSPSIYSAANFDLHSDNIAICRKSSASGPPKSADKPMTIPKTVAPMAATAPIVAAAASSSAGGIGWTILSTANTWYSSRCVTFLEGLNNREVDWEGIPFVLLDASISWYFALIHNYTILQPWPHN
jgi:hypothetical protein